MTADAAQTVAASRLTRGLPPLSRPRLRYAIQDAIREERARKHREQVYATTRRQQMTRSREEQAAGEVLAESPLLNLKYVSNMTEEEIAEHTGLPRHTVRDRLAAELTQARQLLQ